MVQIIDWEERYSECLALLQNAQEEVRELQKAAKPRVIRYHCTNDSPYVSGDSLAVQLENSIRRSLLYPDDCRSVFTFVSVVVVITGRLQCFDTVGWVAGKASGP